MLPHSNNTGQQSLTKSEKNGCT